MSQLDRYSLTGSWEEVDADTFCLDGEETIRQTQKIILIAAISQAPSAVKEALASSFGNIDAEGFHPSRLRREGYRALQHTQRQLAYHWRYFDNRSNKCTEYANIVEEVAQRRLAQLFANTTQGRICQQDIIVNVQPLSGAIANTAVFDALLEPGDSILAMDLGAGGHLSHGSNIHRSGKLYRTINYGVDPITGRIDYDQVEHLARANKPKMIIAGASSYPWGIDWERLRKIVNQLPTKTWLVADVAHPAGLVVSGLFPNPIGFADVTTLVTYKTFCGPRGAAILTTDNWIANRIERAIFPGLQSAPNFPQIAAMAVAFKIAQSDGFQVLQQNIVANAQALATGLQQRGIPIAYGGTSTHLVVIDLKSIIHESELPLSGEVASRILDVCGIVTNKNMLPGDSSSASATGLRLGTTWVSQSGFGTVQMDQLAGLIHQTLSEITPFRYPSASIRQRGSHLYVSDLLRGKIAFETIQSVREGVNRLVAHEDDIASLSKRPAISSSTAPEPIEHSRDLSICNTKEQEPIWMISTTDRILLQIEGERAIPFLEDVCTSSIYGSVLHRPIHTSILNPDSTKMDDVVLIQLSPLDSGLYRFLLATSKTKTTQVEQWLQALSDGYVFFGHEDIFAKIQGPVSIERIVLGTSSDSSRESILLSGKSASDVANQIKRDYSSQLALSLDSRWSGQIAVVSGYGQNDELLSSNVSTYANNSNIEIVAEDEILLGHKIADQNLARIDSRKPFFVGQPSPSHSRVPKPDHKLCLERSAKSTPKETPLYEDHLGLGAHFVTFAGWRLPAWYAGAREEHEAIRRSVALFDLTHMGILDVTGPEATWFLDAVTTNNISALRIGQGCYSFFLDPKARVLDDCYIYRLQLHKYMIVVNAANADFILNWLNLITIDKTVPVFPDRPETSILAGAEIRDLRSGAAGLDQRVCLALQGPQSLAILSRLAPTKKTLKEITTMNRNDVVLVSIGGYETLISKTGYTGEDNGFEVYTHPDAVSSLWKIFMRAGENHGLRPAGIVARDMARIEAGFPLYGQELAGPRNISPLGAGYGSFVKLHKPFFIGRNDLLRAESSRREEVARFVVTGHRSKPVRSGDLVVDLEGNGIGFVTSCTTIGSQQFGLAYIDRDYVREGTQVEIRGSNRFRNQALENCADDQSRRCNAPNRVSASITARFPCPK